MHRPRDSQRSKLYAAEDAFCKRPDICDIEGGFDGIDEIQLYTGKLLASAWFHRRWPVPAIQVIDGRARRSPAAFRRRDRGDWQYFIAIPRFARHEESVLHEIAHCCVYATKTEPLSGHGWQFAATLLDLIGRQMGADARRVLVDEFKVRRVRYRKPRQLSPEHRAALSARMAAIREQQATGA